MQQLEFIPFQEANPNKKQHFLTSLKRNGKYRRYNNIPIRYAGGKSLAVGHIIENIPHTIPKLVSPFIGGGSVEIACANELDIPVYAYDVFRILTTYWRVQLRSPNKLADRLLQWKPTDTAYKHVKQTLKDHWTQHSLIQNPLDLAAHYWFNHNLSYGPGFLGWMSKMYQEQDRFERLVEKVRNFRAPNLKVKQGSFEKTIPQHNTDFLYCDPPYYLDGDSRMFRGIYPQRNFPVHHRGFDHHTLRDLLYAHKGGFVLSYNDCQIIREWYSGFKIVEVEWQYSLGQGETRIGKNRIENGTKHYVKKSHELLIVKES